MSPFMERAEEIQARFASLAALEGVDVLVDRQKDITSEVAKSVAKAKGAMVAVLWAGGKPVDGDPLVMDALYEVRIYAKPVIRGEETPADEMAAAMIPAIHDWQADATAHCDWDFRVTGDLDLIPDKNFLFYFFPVTGRVRLIQPTLI